MSLFRIRRLVSVASAAVLALMLLGPGTVSATVAPFEFTNFASLPSTVSPGADAGYQFTIHNKSTSTNISQLFLNAKDSGVPTFVWNDRGITCQTSPYLSCAFGALNAGAEIKVVVAYDTTGFSSPFSVTFNLDSVGGATKDPHQSHGDSVSKTLTTAINNGINFKGAFETTPEELSTVGIDGVGLSKRNAQASSILPPSGSAFGNYQPVTVEENVAAPTDDPCATLNCIGDWSFVRVGDGTVGPVKVSILLYGPSVPGQATVDTIGLWHEGSSPNPIMLRCSDPSSIPSGGSNECVTVTKQGNNILIVAWLLHNGGYRGTF